MINNFETEREILDYLMTSEFLDEELTPTDLRELLLKFRYFYRSSHSKQMGLRSKVHKLDNKIELLERKLNEVEEDLDDSEEKYNKVVKRDLSPKERLSGKIIENEYRRKFKFRLFKK